MIRQGQKVETLTKKVGQRPRVGTVEALHGESAEVLWEDGHRSILSRSALTPVRKDDTASQTKK